MKNNGLGLTHRNEFDILCNNVQKCIKCARMCNSQRVLNRSAGALDGDIMFIGEAPGRLGADSSGIPFHGDKSGHNFEELLQFANLERSRIFVTNAVLCNPRDDDGNNSTPSKIEIQNCADFLSKQIDIVNPKIVVTLGSTALEATRFTFPHGLTLKKDVRTANSWNNRILIPLYHPGQRAMLHRSFANQRSDYQFVAEQLKKFLKASTKGKRTSVVKEDVITIVKEILRTLNSIDYFRLHKIFYLIEYNYFKTNSERLTNAYIVRQKDGPYCTDLHIQRLKKSIPELEIRQKNGKLTLSLTGSLFNSDNPQNAVAGETVKEVLRKYASLSNEEIKTKVYLTSPMRKFLQLEKYEHLNLYNSPIIF